MTNIQQNRKKTTIQLKLKTFRECYNFLLVQQSTLFFDLSNGYYEQLCNKVNNKYTIDRSNV